MSGRRIGLAAALALTATVFAAARRYRPDDAPFRPLRDDEVLERLAAGTGADPELDATRALERELARAPDDLSIAARVARRHIEAARQSGDARRLSYAEAALGPWWSQSAPPLGALVLRATIRQSRHEFDRALDDLDAAVRLAPGDVQAWLTRAAVLTARARYDDARASCAQLAGLASPLVSASCAAPAEAISGDGAAARTRLAILVDAPGADPRERSWARSVLGEVSWLLGDSLRAERDLRATLAADPADTYTRGLLCDLLLDLDRPGEVLTLVASDEVNEVLVLRRAIAARRTGAPDADALAQRLARHADALRARGDQTHQREEARRLLVLLEQPQAALREAQAGFKVQTEPWDARLLLEAAALVARDPAQAAAARAAAAPALTWLARTHCPWPPLATAAKALEGSP